MPRPMSRIACVLLVAVVAGACRGDDGDEAATTSSSATSSTTAEVTTTVAPSTEPSDDPAPCPDDPPPVGEARGGALVADVDGDGVDDEVTVHVAEATGIEVAVGFGAGGRTVAGYDDDSVATFADIRVTRITDVDDDGDDDLWLVVGAGASVEVVSLVVADGCDLRRPDAGDRPNAFPVGASVGNVSGIECVEGGFVEHEGENVGDSTYRGTSTTWAVTDTASLDQIGEESFEIDLAAADFSRYATLACD